MVFERVPTAKHPVEGPPPRLWKLPSSGEPAVRMTHGQLSVSK